MTGPAWGVALAIVVLVEVVLVGLDAHPIAWAALLVIVALWCERAVGSGRG